MCIFSTCGQLVYGVLMVGCLVLTAVALFTDSWAETKQLVNGKSHTAGIMPWTCVTNTKGSKCSNWWNESGNWLRAVGVMMCVALALQILALAWNLFTCFACCCKKWLIQPLSLFAIFITLFLAASVITYAANNKNLWVDGKPYASEPGWSFWVAVTALCVAFGDIIVGALTVFLGRHHL